MTFKQTHVKCEKCGKRWVANSENHANATLKQHQAICPKMS